MIIVEIICGIGFIFSIFYFQFLRENGFKSIFGEKIDRKNISEESYQQYAKFYGNIVPTDVKFDEKLIKISDLILKNKVTDISVIAEKSYCNVTECILKIQYLENKGCINNFYIDTVNNILVPCSKEDEEIINKYKPYIYNSHLQLNEILSVIPNPKCLSVTELKDSIFRDLNYLDEKGLLNGVRVDDVDGTITYFNINSNKGNSDLETVHCSNCGALNDVDVNGKARCAYCKNIVVGSKYID